MVVSRVVFMAVQDGMVALRPRYLGNRLKAITMTFVETAVSK